MRVDRHIAPEQQGNAATRAPFLEHAHGTGHAFCIAGKEQHRHAVVTFGRQDVAAFLGFLAEEAMRNLEQDASAVARVLLEPDTTTMLEVHEHRKGVVDHLMGFAALKVSQRPDTACVVLEFGAVKPLGAFHRFDNHCSALFHDAP